MNFTEDVEKLYSKVMNPELQKMLIEGREKEVIQREKQREYAKKYNSKENKKLRSQHKKERKLKDDLSFLFINLDKCNNCLRGAFSCHSCDYIFKEWDIIYCNKKYHLCKYCYLERDKIK